jgi:putative hydrolase of the HAD superfamily
MARELSVDPERFASRWLATFDDRVRGNLGTFRETVERFARELGGTVTRAAAERAMALRVAYARSLINAGVSSLHPLEGLRRNGVRLALVSDTSDDTVRVWPETDFAPLFEVTVFSCVERIRKPDPRIFRVALERLHVPPSACVFVGDGGSHELSSAESAGISAFQYIFPEEEGTAFRVDADSSWKGTRWSTFPSSSTWFKNIAQASRAECDLSVGGRHSCRTSNDPSKICGLYRKPPLRHLLFARKTTRPSRAGRRGCRRP